jgi:hypothetical protein
MQFNISEEHIAAILLEKFKKQKICLPTEFKDDKGRPSMVDHIEFWTPAIQNQSGEVIINIPNPSPEWSATGHLEPRSIKTDFGVAVVENVSLYIATIDNLEAMNLNALNPEAFIAPLAKVTFDLTMQVNAGVPRLCMQMSDVRFGIDVEPAVLAKIRASIGAITFCEVFDLSTLETLKLGKLEVVNAGVSYDSDLRIVALRLEVRDEAFDSVATLDSWKRFYSGDIAADLGIEGKYLKGRDWSLFVGQRPLVASAVKLVAESLSGPGAGKFSLNTGPDGGWTTIHSLPAGAMLGRIDVSFGGEIVDACTCLWGEIDLDVDVTATIVIDVMDPNILRSRVKLDWALNDLEVFCCSMSAAAFWPVVGGILLEDGKIDWNQFLLGLEFGPLAGFLGVIYTSTTKTPPGAELKGECKKVSDTEFTCKQAVEFKHPVFGELTLKSADGLSNGLLLSGDLGPIRNHSHARLDMTATDFSWMVSGACSGVFDTTTTAEIVLRNTGESPLVLCEAALRSDPVGQFGPSVKISGGLVSGGAHQISISSLTKEYLANPYPLKLLFKTNGGARLVTIPAPKALSDDARVTMLDAWKAGCSSLSDTFWETEIRPKWGLDPGRPGVDIHIWDIAIGGLQPGESVSILNTDSQIVNTAAASSFGVAQIAAFVPAGRTDGEISISRKSNHNGATSPAEGYQFYMHQALLMRETIFDLGDRCIHLDAGRIHGADSVVIATSGGLHVFNLTAPALPNLAESISIPGLRGATIWQDRCIAWGEQGLAVLQVGGNGFTEAVVDAGDRGVLSLSRSGGFFYVLTDASIDVYDRALKLVGREHVEGADRIAASGGMLVAGRGDSILAFDLSDGQSPKGTGEFEFGDIAGLLPRRLLDDRAVFFVQSAEGGSLLEFSVQNQMQEIARFEQTPWFVGSAKVGQTVARLDSAGRGLSVYNIAQSGDV